MTEDNDKKGAAVKFPPPLIFVGFMIFAGIVEYFWPLSLIDSMSFKYVGAIIVLLSLSIVFIASRSFKKFETNIEPWKPTHTLISDGIFAYSRNPIYVAFCLATMGIGIIIGSLWVIISVIPAAFTTHHIAIRKEEAYLEQKFGALYLSYKKNVRRWV